MDPGYEMVIDDLRVWNKDIVNEMRGERLTGGYTDPNGIMWDTDPIAIQNLSGVCVLIACGVVTQNQIWRDLNNVDHEMTPTELVTLAGALAIFVRTCYQTSWFHKANLDNCPDIQSLLEYDSTSQWP